MIKYEVGQRFPHEKYLNRGELTVSILNESFFDVFVSLHGISPEEKNKWKSGNLTVCLFEMENIPFIAFDFGNGFSVDVNININKVNEEQLDTWLNSESNVVNLFLVDAQTGNLVTMRMISLSMIIAESIRDICEKQSELSTEEVESKISNILSVVSTSEMIKKAKHKQPFKR